MKIISLYSLPDTPLDDESKNYLLNVPKQDELIDFSEIESINSFRAVLKTLFELEGCFEELQALDLEEAYKLTFDELYNEIDVKLAKLNYAYSIFESMAIFRRNEFTLRKNGNANLMQSYSDERSSVFKSKTIFKLMVNLEKQKDKLTDQQQRVVKKYIQEGTLNGLHLDLAVDQYEKTIQKYSQDFFENANMHSQNYCQKVINEDYVKTVPHYSKSMVEGKSKVNLFFNPTVYNRFLANCNDKKKRHAYWPQYNNRASISICDRKFANNIVVDEQTRNCSSNETKELISNEIKEIENLEFKSFDSSLNKNLVASWLKLSKFRLTSLVVLTTLTGHYMGLTTCNYELMFFTLLGTGLCSSSAAALNQFLEIPYDSQMSRTKNRPLVTHNVTPLHACLFACLTGLTGISLLALNVNMLTASLGASNLILYSFIYTPMKRFNILNTWVGSIVGAIPPIMGYTAATGTIGKCVFNN